MRSCSSLLLVLTVLVTSGYAQDTIQVFTGWNIVGSLRAGAIPDVLVSEPPGIVVTSFFGYSPASGYQSSDTLQKGLGYWIKVSGDGLIIFGSTGVSGSCGTKQVVYGGETYNTVLIGEQCWLKENLNVGTMVAVGTAQTNNAVIEKYCYGDVSGNCAAYGGLYQWNEAMEYTTAEAGQGICPTGWHLPTYEEFQTLSTTVGGDGNALKKAGVGTGAGLGTNASGFALLLAGFRHEAAAYFNLGDLSNVWSSTQGDATSADFMQLTSANPGIFLPTGLDKNRGFSVRCLED